MRLMRSAAGFGLPATPRLDDLPEVLNMRNGKCALVTGGASGIGHATCLAFAREGADIAVADMNLEGAEINAREHANSKEIYMVTIGHGGDRPVYASDKSQRLGRGRNKTREQPSNSTRAARENAKILDCLAERAGFELWGDFLNGQ
jgi:NAD(P)-dependent dehydrogenase (short-subunit alcohol dehydrogenase family)